MSLSLPFPTNAVGQDMNKAQVTTPSSNFFTQNHGHNMKIDIPKEKEDQNSNITGTLNRKHHSAVTPASTAQQQQYRNHPFVGKDQLPLQSPSSIVNQYDNHIPQSRGSSIHPTSTAGAGSVSGTGTTPANWVYHPRQPHQNAESYFPSHHNNFVFSGSGTVPTSAHTAPAPRTPGSVRGHSRQTSGAGQQIAQSALVPTRRSSKATLHSMNLNLNSNNGNAGEVGSMQPHQGDFANYTGPSHAGPPSPSTLTDIILGLHSTFYGAKRTPDEVRERVYAFYDNDAIFESPLLAAKGREQIANQFIMAFSLPGMDVTSELRDVICSDFEFDGTRAGIIDQTINVTFLPKLFGSDTETFSASQSRYAQYAANDQVNNDYAAGTSTPGYTLQSAGITPHPFASQSQAQTPAGGIGSMFSRFTSSRPHSPTTPFSMSNLWGTSRPHTPGAGQSSSIIRPLSSTTTANTQRPSTPPSVNGGDDEDEETGRSYSTIHPSNMDTETSHFMSANEAGGGQMTRLQMPQDAVKPAWTSDGLGRASIRALLWGILHPRSVLKSLCTIQLRLMSRLEFNDAGLIVRHEDTWGVRETIEGTIPFASVVYALERRVVGYLCSFAVGKGFRLRSALTRSIEAGDQRQWSSIADEKYRPDVNEAARALLLGHHDRQEQLVSMARSRASSPSRHRFSGHATPHSLHTFGPGTRSRARSLVGQQLQGIPTRAASSDNLWNMNNMATYGDRERGMTTGGVDSLPPDSSARYRDRGIRRPVSSTASAPSTGQINSLDSLWQHGDVSSQGQEGLENKSRAPDRDL